VIGADRRYAVSLELYVQGQSAQSAAALEVVTRVCEAHLPGQYRLDVIDIFQDPERTRAAGITVAPALVRLWPEPMVRWFGRLSAGQVRDALEVPAADGSGERGHGC
jgi:circadian clock protein KaiB